MKLSVSAVFLSFLLAGCDSIVPHQYVPEVGYYEDNKEQWWVGERYWSKETCLWVAFKHYLDFDDRKSRRSFSWACRVMRWNTFVTRTRGL